MPIIGGYSGNFNAGGSGRSLNPADPYYGNKIVHIVSGSYTTSTTSTTTISNLTYDPTWSGSNFTVSGNTITFTGQFSTVVYALRQTSGKVYLEFTCLTQSADFAGCYIGVQRQPVRAGNFHDGTSGNGNQGLGTNFSPSAGITYGVLVDIDAQTVSWNNGTPVSIPGTGALYFGVYDGTSSGTGSGTVNWGVTSFVSAIPAGAVAAGTITTSSGGATNLAIVDTGINQYSIANTSVLQSGISPYGSRWSGYFGGTGNYLYNANSIFNISSATAKWNFECWVYPIVSVSTVYTVFFSIGNSANAGSSFWVAWDYSTSKFRFIQQNGSSSPVDFTTVNTYPGARWYHVAVSCDANSVRRMYIDGVLDGTQTYALTLASGTGWIINGQNDNQGLGYSGGTFYISNVRFNVGDALYTTSTSFTVPSAPLAATTQTQLLICQDNIFKDNSSFARTGITKSGANVSPAPFNKFSPKSLSRLTDYGGSGYFNGTSSFLQIANAPALNLAGTTWTVECWLRPNSDYSIYRTIFAKRISSSGTTSYEGYLKISTGVISYYNGTEYSSTVTLQPGAWSHCAWVYDGVNLKIYVNGVSVFTLATTIVELDQPLIIGNARGYSEFYSGWISNFRMVKGTAVYTGNFTPPSKPLKRSGADSALSYTNTTNVDTTFPATNTSLFLEFSNLAFYDQAGNRYFTTVGSTGKTTAVTKWNNGSINISGGGATASMFSTDPATTSPATSIITLPAAFTIECWVYLNNSGRHVIVGEPSGNVTSTTYGFGIFNTSGANASTGAVKGLCLILSPINNSGGNMLYSGQYPTLSQWTHVAVTRTSSNEVMFFMDGIKGSTANDNANAQAGSNLGTAPNLSGSLNMSLYFGDFDGFTAGGNAITMAAGFNGYIEDFAIYNGVAKYTASFTKPGRPITTK